ncbi:glycosyltransferase [Chloroherpeton thalassium ATCC 35110]|uniref:Glycosyltransferase n=1 Tax=Chloroherpeton thalassium (strain ATCC 35110 / GB-78) TaxID=517418 RepID=B3QV20_CHLT3|nr:glycosyltransferase domain-containing protein [Chloroherpeton thalassium]ACF14521.1 glycosyltransferase [Chloroherpeton thalassium ATCC 35110]
MEYVYNADTLVVYTALFGDYDDLVEPQKKFQKCDFICFTDQKNLKSSIWKFIFVENSELSPSMMNRKYKILPHLFLKEYKYSLYIDANIGIIENPYDLLKKYMDEYDFVAPKHFERVCLYEEAKECVILGRVSYSETLNQMKEYRIKKFPKNFGLSENNILLRKHNYRNVINLMTDWWAELNKWTKRDQLSLGYVLWKNGSVFRFMNESARKGMYFKYFFHRFTKKEVFLFKVKYRTLISLRRLYYAYKFEKDLSK